MMQNQDDNKPDSWFVKRDGLVLGPLASARVRHLLLDGELELGDQISPDKHTWKAIGDLPNVVPLQLRAQAGDREAQAKIAERERVRAKDNEEENRFPLRTLVISLTIIAIFITLSVWYGMPKESESSLCDAPPAPGVIWRNCRFGDLDLGDASLAGANLNSTVLRGANLKATDLRRADIRYADLSYADLRHTQLQAAVLVGANLQFADLGGADLSQADLRFADLSNSRIDDARLQGARLQGALWLNGRSCGAESIGKCEFDGGK
jgi:hypothetical protein